jgi:predicted KAP-like P-loop ATPase
VFDADRPITAITQDKLNRSEFARYLARCLLDHNNPESLVVGLYGGWGVGKTSIINMMVEELKFASTNLPDEEKPILLNFSPWSYSGQQPLVYSFFRRLSATLRNETNLENKERIVHLLELYVSFFTQKPIPKVYREREHWWKKWLPRHHDHYGWESGRDLTLVKAELNELLKNQKRKIIVIIDNISRITPDEIKHIFQIVKSMGDYSNTTYLLAFDKIQVINAINHVDGEGGEALIEKVVQLPFEVPSIAPQDLEGIFSDRLKPILTLVPEDAWQPEAWASLYYSSLKFFFNHCRDISRYVNALNFGYTRLKDVVNPVDFFALTALEVFAPQVYQGVRNNKDLFTDLMNHVYLQTSDDCRNERIRCDEIIARSDRIEREPVRELLIHLFPRLLRIYHPEQAYYHTEALARQQKRICSPDLFDVYFRLSMPSGFIPHTEFETILKLASNPEAFDQALARLNQDNRILQFLNQCDDSTLRKIPFEQSQAIINALLDNGDLFPPGIGGLLSLDTTTHIHRIVQALLHQFDNSEIRVAMLQKAIKQANKSLAILIHEVSAETHEHMIENTINMPFHIRDLTDEQLNHLQKDCVLQIKHWASSNRLSTHPKLMTILKTWLTWGDPDECRNFVVDMTSTDKGLVLFLQAALETAITQTITRYEKNASWLNYLNDINQFISTDLLKAHATLVFENGYFEKLSEREQLAIIIYLDLMKSNAVKELPKTTD